MPLFLDQELGETPFQSQNNCRLLYSKAVNMYPDNQKYPKEISSRDSLNVLRQIKKLLFEAALGKSMDIPTNIASIYNSNTDFTRLKTQLLFLPSAIALSLGKMAVQSNVSAISSELVASETMRKNAKWDRQAFETVVSHAVTMTIAKHTFSALKERKIYEKFHDTDVFK